MDNAEKCSHQKEGHCSHLISEGERSSVPCTALTRNVINRIIGSPLEDLGRMNLPHLAREMNVSTLRLCRIFHQDTGHCLSQYIRTVKMIRSALSLLGEPELRVRDVIEQAGFSCPDHFRRLFRTCFSRSPSDFRLSSTARASAKAEHRKEEKKLKSLFSEATMKGKGGPDEKNRHLRV